MWHPANIYSESVNVPYLNVANVIEYEIIIIECNASFYPGDADENFYVVQSGKLNVFITETDGSTVALKVVKEGDSIASLLSFTDVLTVSYLKVLIFFDKYFRKDFLAGSSATIQNCVSSSIGEFCGS